MYEEIRAFLEDKYGIVLSQDQLRGRLKQLGLRRRGNESSLEEVEAAIQVSTQIIKCNSLDILLGSKHSSEADPEF